MTADLDLLMSGDLSPCECGQPAEFFQYGGARFFGCKACGIACGSAEGWNTQMTKPEGSSGVHCPAHVDYAPETRVPAQAPAIYLKLVDSFGSKDRGEAVEFAFVDSTGCRWYAQAMTEQMARAKVTQEIRGARVPQLATDVSALLAALDPDAWRNFDGEGNYDYTDDDETSERWIKHNGPKYADWCEPLFREKSFAPAFQKLVSERDDALADAKMVRSYEDEWARLLREAQEERDALRAQTEAKDAEIARLHAEIAKRDEEDMRHVDELLRLQESEGHAVQSLERVSRERDELRKLDGFPVRIKIDDEPVTLNAFEKRVYHLGQQRGWNHCLDAKNSASDSLLDQISPLKDLTSKLSNSLADARKHLDQRMGPIKSPWEHDLLLRYATELSEAESLLRP